MNHSRMRIDPKIEFFPLLVNSCTNRPCIRQQIESINIFIILNNIFLPPNKNQVGLIARKSVISEMTRITLFQIIWNYLFPTCWDIIHATCHPLMTAPITKSASSLLTLYTNALHPLQRHCSLALLLSHKGKT